MPVIRLGAFGFRPSSEVLKYGGVAGILLALAIVGGVAAVRPDSPINIWWNGYLQLLDKKLRELFLPAKPLPIAVTQALSVLAVLTLYPWLGLRSTLALLLTACFGPVLYLMRRKKKRLLALEAQIEPFLLALTNALRTTSSIASALSAVEQIMANPMREELGLVLKELRVGSTIDQALLAMAARTHLSDLDAALSSVLIGRQVGGNLTEILETTAKTLREMSRLIAVLKSKTNSGRVQFIVLAIAPVVIVGTFQYASPGYFNPLLKGVTGAIVLLSAAAMWLVAIGMARKVLKTAL